MKFKSYIFIGISLLLLFAFFPSKTQSNTPQSDSKIIQRADFEFSYCEEFELPYFVKYTINKEDVFGVGNRDKSRWKSDPLVDTKTGANSDYVRSGYDRGHLKPAAVSKTTQDHMNQSHLFSNCSPQLPAFNRGGWRSIEGTVRHIVGDGAQDSVIVYTGPILTGITDYIGSTNKIGIPKYHFKAVLFGDSSKAYAYLCPNEKLIKPYSRYIVSIDSIESLIGIDLYEWLSESLEK